VNLRNAHVQDGVSSNTGGIGVANFNPSSIIVNYLILANTALPVLSVWSNSGLLECRSMDDEPSRCHGC